MIKKYKRVPAKQKGLCFGCAFWENHITIMCNTYYLKCFENGEHLYNLIEVPTILSNNIKVL